MVGRKFTFWVVYDTTSDRQFVKMDSDTGCLAMFDNEESAAAFASDLFGVGYKKVVLYSCPQPDVQVEPVAEVVWPDEVGRRGGFRQLGHSSSPRLPAGTKLYIHPQPAEQKEPDSLCVEDDGCPTERAVLQRFWRKHHQPAPDVTQLVEALERIMTWPDGGRHYGQSKIKVFAAEALAAYHNQGVQP